MDHTQTLADTADDHLDALSDISGCEYVMDYLEEDPGVAVYGVANNEDQDNEGSEEDEENEEDEDDGYDDEEDNFVPIIDPDEEDADDPGIPNGNNGHAENQNNNNNNNIPNFGLNDPYLNVRIRILHNLTVREVLLLVLVLAVRH